MQNLLEDLKEADAEYNEPADERKILLDNKTLEEAGFIKVPDVWLDILRMANGVWFNGGEIYGVQPDNPSFRDIVAENQDIVWEKTDGVLLLGENDNDLLAYDEDGWFYILDKDDETVWNKTKDAKAAVRYILKL